MKKICKYLLLLIPFMFMFFSCVNLIEENVNTQISYTVGEEAARSISKSLEGSRVIDNSTELKVTSVLLNKDNKQVTSASVNTTLGNLASVKLHLSKIPFGNDYTLKMGVLYKDCLIYEGESKGISITSGNPNQVAPSLALRRVLSSITYNLNGGSFPNGLSGRNEYFVNEHIELLKPIQANKTFDGWYTTPSFSGKKVETLGATNFLGNVNLYAKWISETCTITYDTGIEELVQPKSIKDGESLNSDYLPTLKKEGSIFKGWYLFDEKIKSGYKVITDITLTAKWEQMGQVSNVTFSPAKSSSSDVYIDYNDNIYLSTDTYGATITYTTDGNDPKISKNKQVYSNDKPILFTQDISEKPLHIMAYAHNGIDKDSEVTKTTYRLKTYTVSFDTKDPNIDPPTAITNLKRGEMLTKDKLTALATTDDEFISWQYNGAIVKEGYIVKEDMVLTPLWRKRNYVSDVTFSIPGGLVDYTDKVELSTATTGAIIYYTLDGSDPKDNGIKYEKPFTFTPSNETTNIRCYAKKDGLISSNITNSTYTLRSYDVVYDSLNKGVEPSRMTVLSGTQIINDKLPDLEEDGYIFKGWTVNGSKIDKNTGCIIDKDTLIKAEWEPCNYNITYVSEGVIDNTNPQTVTINDSFTLTKPTRKGYDFKGWYLEDNYQTPKTNITKQNTDLTLYANWTIINYNITYDLNNGIFPSPESVINSYSVTSSEIKLPTPTRENYTFDGWFTDNSLATGKTESIPTDSIGDKVFYAKWTENGKTADVTFDGPIGNEVESSGTNVTLNCSTPNARIYYTTDNTEPNTTLVPVSSGKVITLSSKTTLKSLAIADGMKQSNTTTAEYVLKKYTVNFQTEYGTVPSQNLEEGSKVTEPSGLTRTGYTLSGWIYTKGATPESDVLWDFSNDTVPANDITLIAKWIPNALTISYKNDSDVLVEIRNYSYNEQFVIPSLNLETEGYILTWSTALTPSTSTKYSVGQLVNINDIIKGSATSGTLYANLTPITYTIKYNLDGGTNASGKTISDETVAYEKSVTLPAYETDYEKVSYNSLNKWKSEDGSIYNVGESVSKLSSVNNSTVVLTAQWIEVASPFSNPTFTTGDKEVTINWDTADKPDIKKAEISYFSASSKALTITVDVTPGISNYATLTNLTNGTPYSVSIIPIDKYGQKGTSIGLSNVYAMNSLTETPKTLSASEYKSPNQVGAGNWEYIAFGDYPQTLKATDVTLSENTVVINGWTCKYGSDGYYYTMVTAKTDPSVTDIINGDSYYVKLEPIIWRVLTDKYNGNKLLFAESAIAASLFDGNSKYENKQFSETIREHNTKTIHSNNYEYSEVRAFLNGYDYISANNAIDTKYKENNFLKNAFTSNAQTLILSTNVDNSPSSTFAVTDKNVNKSVNQYACNNTKDKVFLLSKNEVSNKSYGFDYTNPNSDQDVIPEIKGLMRKLTFYAKLTGASQGQDKSSSKNDYSPYSYYWTRSPSSTSPIFASRVHCSGSFAPMVDTKYDPTFTSDKGIVPAIVIRGNGEDSTPPSEVANLEVVPTEDSIKLTWKNPTTSDFSKVNIITEPAVSISPITGNAGSNGTYTLTGLSRDVNYKITVSTEDSNGNKSNGIIVNQSLMKPIVYSDAPINATTKEQVPQKYNFGLYPQTIKDDTVRLSTNTKQILNWTCYYGSDGYYYVEGTPETGCNGKTFSNGKAMEHGKPYYFKLEPITWIFTGSLTDDFCAQYYTEKLIYNCQWGDNSQHNMYEQSLVSEKLNSEFKNNGFTSEMLSYIRLDKKLENMSVPQVYFWIMDFNGYEQPTSFTDDTSRDAPSTDYAFLQDTYNDGNTVNDVVQGTRDYNSINVGFVNNTGGLPNPPKREPNGPKDGVYPYRVSAFFKMKIQKFDVPKAGASNVDQIRDMVFKVKDAKCDGDPIVTSSDGLRVNARTIDSTSFEVSLQIPKNAGNYEIDVNYRETKYHGTLVVKDYSTLNLEVGDVFVNDGSIVKSSNATSHKSDAVAVFYGAYDSYGAPLGIAVKDASPDVLAWANENSFGHMYPVEEISCHVSAGTADTVRCDGDINGSDNFDKLIENYTKGGKNTYLDDCPAFKSISDYITANSTTLTGEYSNGWYIPSIKELCDLYKTYKTSTLLTDVVVTSLGGSSFDKAYWSSSQSSVSQNADKAWSVDFSNGQPIEDFKHVQKNVRLIRAF